jgi:hypothetical protein
MATVDVGEGEAFAAPLIERIREWFFNDGAWWLSSCVFHMLLICILALIGSRVATERVGDAPSFDEAQLDPSAREPKLEKFEVGETPIEPTELSTETLTLAPPGQIEQTEKHYDDNPVFEEAGGGVALNSSQPSLGGLGGFDVKALGAGPAVRGAGGVGVGVGSGRSMGSGGEGIGFGGRGSGYRKAMVGRFGGTKQSERAVAAALNWLARHQNSDGSWGLDTFRKHCTDHSCTGPGAAHGTEVGATAMGLLPFLAADQTHQTKGPYKPQVQKAVAWLIQNEHTDGDLRGSSTMYCHGLATIALCEAYGMTKDAKVGGAAQKAINFIQGAQHPTTGGWRYHPRDEGDTSVVGWQVMALKSGQMAGLSVSPAALQGAKEFLRSVASGYHDEQFAYQPKHSPSDTMTSVGLLCSQYLGARRNDPQMIDGAQYLMDHPPSDDARNIYYWYYATQVMHNVSGPQWDNWNRSMRRILIDSQVKEGCAAGSWDPSLPSRDHWGDRGGRVMMTSFGALTLEVYYRYLPLYKLDTEDANPAAPGAAPAAQPAAAPAEKDAQDLPAAEKNEKKPPGIVRTRAGK